MAPFGHGQGDRPGARERLGLAIDSAVAQEADGLAQRLNFLATVGSVAPFVGLFGTVWGIMNSFFQIGQQQNSSLAVVAPGISEALFATAIGLFAAIPAVIAYNRFSHRVNAFEAALQRFADRFLASLSRQLEG
jgi:biopolymer transport protein TolQ